MSLYSDNKPNNTIKGTGFKDEKTAKKTLDLISKRSILYQITTVNALYNRAKNHPHQTEDMKKAMKIFERWLNKNKNKKRKYEYLPLKVIKKYEKLADKYGVSEVSRGKKKSNKSDCGFLEMYKKYKKPNKLSFIPAKSSSPSSNDYDSLREKFLNARLGQIKKSKTKLYDQNKNPTKQHLVLIMNAYSPNKNLYNK